MKGIILKEGQEFFTDIKIVFDSIKNQQLKYNWLITDLELNEDIPILTDKKPCFISGKELTKIVNEKEDMQWIWGVLSAFPKDISMEEILKYPLPYADEYKGFWQNPVSLQHPLAVIKIVPFDSSLLLLISKEDKIIDDFKKSYPLSEDLEEYNKQFIN